MDLKNAEMIIKKIYNWVTGDDANRFTGQKTSDKSISVVFSSDGGGVNIGDVELVDSNGDPLISQKTMDESLPVTIASNQSTLPITGAVTNTVLTDIYDAVNHFIKVNIQNASIAVTGTFWQAIQPISGAITNAVLTDIHDAVNHRAKVNIENTSLAVTGSFYQATQPISETYTGISNGKYTILADDTVESIVSVSTPCKKVSLRAGTNAGNVYFGGASPALTGSNSDYLESDAGIILEISDLNLLRVYGKIGYTLMWTYIN